MSFSSTMRFLQTGASNSCSPIGAGASSTGYAGAGDCGKWGCLVDEVCVDGVCVPLGLKPWPKPSSRRRPAGTRFLATGYAGAADCGPHGCPPGEWCDAGVCRPFDLKPPFPTGVHRLNRRRRPVASRPFAGG